MASIFSNLELPDINGILHAGIAIGTDMALPINDKLSLVTMEPSSWDDLGEEEKKRTRLTMVASILNKLYGDINSMGNELAIEVLMYGVYGGLVGDLINYKGADVVRGLELCTTELDPYVKKMLSPDMDREALRSALTIAIATKVSWWSTNHHLGAPESSSKMGGYLLKCLRLKYPGKHADLNSDVLVEAVHRLGHYYDTIKILKIAGVEGLVEQPERLYMPHLDALILSEDAQLRFRSLPAGTAKVAVAYAALGKLSRSPIIVICPDLGTMTSVGAAHKVISSNRASYHMGAIYLTGAARKTDLDQIGSGVLGRLGTFVNHYFKRSTLAKSPHMRCYKDMDDYSPDFEDNIVAMIAQSAKTASDFTRAYTKVASAAATNTMETIVEMFGGKVTPAQTQLAESINAQIESAGSAEEEDDESEEDDEPAEVSPMKTRKRRREKLKKDAAGKRKR